MAEFINRTRIKVFESSLEKLGRILSEKYGIRLIFKHDVCLTTGKVIYLPIIPENASNEFLEAIQGYLDHEVAHIIFSDLSKLKKIKINSKIWNIFQSLEDIRIEKRMRELWRGSKVNLKNCNEWSLRQLKTKWNELSDFGKLNQAICAVGTSGKDHWFFREVIEPDNKLIKKLSQIDSLIQETDSLSDTESIIEHAQKILDALGEKEETEETQDPNKKNNPPTINDDNDNDDDSDDLPIEGNDAPENDLPPLEKDNELTSKQNMIRNAAKSQMAEEDQYLIYTTEGDVIQHIKDGDKVQFNNLLTESRGIVHAIKRKFELNLLSISKSKWAFDKTRGLINPKSIFRVPLETSKRIFRQRVNAPGFNTVVSLWIDHSGSMEGEKLKVACTSTIIFGEALRQLNIPFEVIGYSTTDYNTGKQRYSKASSDEQNIFKRWGNLWIGIYKSFDEDWKLVRHRCVLMGRNQKYNTYDGESIRIAASRLLHRKEDRKILFVFNDGDPCPNIAEFVGDHEKYLSIMAKEIEKVIELFSIGICSDEVKKYYKNYAVINNVSELPNVMITQLDTMLRKGKKLIKSAR